MCTGRFPRVSPLGHCIFQSRVPGVCLFSPLYPCANGNAIKRLSCTCNAVPPPDTSVFIAQDSRGSSGHCRHARRTVIGFSRLRSSSPFPREVSANIAISGVLVERKCRRLRSPRRTVASLGIEVAFSAVNSPSLSAIYRQTGCFSTGRIFSCATISSAVQ